MLIKAVEEVFHKEEFCKEKKRVYYYKDLVYELKFHFIKHNLLFYIS